MNITRKVVIPNELLIVEIEQLLVVGQHVTIRVRGNSMNPFLVDRRDDVILSPFKKDDIKKGCIVLARTNCGREVLHRIIRFEHDRIILMGDGNLREIEYTEFGKIIGVVKEVIRKGKKLECNSFHWRFNSFLWRILLPVRRYLLAIWRRYISS